MIVGGLDVDADLIGTGAGEGLDVGLRFGEHEMRIEKQFTAVAAEGGDGLGTEGEVRDEVAVHDIHMEPRQAQLLDDGGAGGEMGVVAGKQRRGEDGRVRHGWQRNGNETRRKT